MVRTHLNNFITVSYENMIYLLEILQAIDLKQPIQVIMLSGRERLNLRQSIIEYSKYRDFFFSRVNSVYQ